MLAPARLITSEPPNYPKDSPPDRNNDGSDGVESLSGTPWLGQSGPCNRRCLAQLIPMSSRQARWQEERRRKGLCVRCGQPRPPVLGSLCLECVVKRREQRRKRLGSRARYLTSKTYTLEEE